MILYSSKITKWKEALELPSGWVFLLVYIAFVNNAKEGIINLHHNGSCFKAFNNSVIQWPSPSYKCIWKSYFVNGIIHIWLYWWWWCSLQKCLTTVILGYAKLDISLTLACFRVAKPHTPIGRLTDLFKPPADLSNFKRPDVVKKLARSASAVIVIYSLKI